MLHEYADDGIRKNHGNVFVGGAQSFADISDGGLDGGAVHDVGFDRRRNQGASGQRFHGIPVEDISAAPAGRSNAVRGHFDSQSGMRHGIEPERGAAHQLKFVNSLPECGRTTQRKSPC